MEKKLPWDLIISKLKNNLLPEQQQKFESWISEEDNTKLFNQIQELWDELREEASGYEPDLDKRWQELSGRLHFASSEKYRSLNKPQKASDPVWRRVAATVVVLIAISAGYFAASVADNNSPSVISHSAMNGKSVVNLPDGTQVWLHKNTTLSYDSRYGKKTREVAFTGEAYFEVARDSKHPFKVKTNDLTVQVYGTKFNLRNRTEEDVITVSLIEGSVSVESGKNIAMLKPGFEAAYYKTTGIIKTTEGDVMFAAKWASDNIVFRENSLEYVVKYLSKWYDVDIKLNEVAKNYDFAYTFTVRDETLEEIIRLISRISPIKYNFDEDNTLYIDVKP